MQLQHFLVCKFANRTKNAATAKNKNIKINQKSVFGM